MGDVADASKIIRRRSIFAERIVTNLPRKEVFRINTHSHDYRAVSTWCINQVGKYGWSLTTTSGAWESAYVIIFYDNVDVDFDELKLIATLRWE